MDTLFNQSGISRLILISCLLVSWPIFATACPVPADATWTAPEKWVWDRACNGEIADFTARYGKYPDPRVAEEWDASFTLRPKFLETIIHKDKYGSALPSQGLRIIGARIYQKDASGIHLEHAEWKKPLWLHWSRLEHSLLLSDANIANTVSLENSSLQRVALESITINNNLKLAGAIFQDIDLSNARIGGIIDLTGATVNDHLEMNGVKLGAHLFMRTRNKDLPSLFDSVGLVGAEIKGQVDMTSATVKGDLAMGGLTVDSDLFLSSAPGLPATFQNIDMVGAKVHGQIDMTGTIVKGRLEMAGLTVGEDLFLRTRNKELPATFETVSLVAAEVDQQLDMTGTTVNGTLELGGLRIGTHLFLGSEIERDSGALLPATYHDVSMVGTQVGRNIEFVGATVHGKLDMNSITAENLLMRTDHAELPATFADVILIGAKVKGQIDLSDATITGSLDLQGAYIRDIIAPSVKAWPEYLMLDGFIYESLGGVDSLDDGIGGANASQSPEWFKRIWFDRQLTYNPQPYQQLAKVFESTGDYANADTIRYYGAERRRSETTGFEWLGLSLLKWTIGYGYGYRYFYALLWILGITFVGAIIKSRAEGRKHPGIADGAFSLDLLLPIVKLDNRHYDDLKFEGWPRYYFMLHQLLGFVLASFIVAGLSGITKF